MSLIESLRTKGKLESRGQFTLDASKASSKLGRSQLGDPSRFLLELIAGFHAMQVDKVEIRWDGSTLTIELSPTILQLEHPSLVSNQLLNPDSIYQRLAVGLSAIEARQGVCIWYGSLRECYGLSDGNDDWTPHTQLIRLEFKEIQELGKLAVERVQSEQNLWPTLELWVQGKQVRPRALSWPWGSVNSSFDYNPGQKIQAGMSPSLKDSEILLLKHGLAYVTELADFPHPVQALVEGFPFKLDAAYSQVIDDQQLKFIHQEVQKQFWQQVESYLQKAEQCSDRVVSYWAPKVNCNLLYEHPSFKKLPCWTSSDGNRFSLQQLIDLNRPVPICTDPSLSIAHGSAVIWVDSEVRRKVLAQYLGSHLYDRTGEIRLDRERQEQQRKFLALPTRSAKLELQGNEPFLNLDSPFEGQIGVRTDGTTSRLMVLYQNRIITTVEREAPNPYVAVVNFQELAVNSTYDGLQSKQALEPLFDQLDRLADTLYKSLREHPDQQTEEIRRHLANLLSKPDGLQSWSLFFDIPLYASRFVDSASSSPKQATLSLNQIRKLFDSGQRIGFVQLEQTIPIEVPFALLGVNQLLSLRTADHGTICSFLRVEKPVIPNLNSLIKKLELRFSVLRECRLTPQDSREPFQEIERASKTQEGQSIRCHLAILPSRGTTKLELLREKIACGTRQVGLGPLAAVAILDCPGLQPKADWSNVENNQVWEACLELLQQAYQAAVNQVVQEFTTEPKPDRLKTWSYPLAQLILDNWPNTRDMGIFPAYPQPVSISELERCQKRGDRIDYLANAEEPKQCKQLMAKNQCGFILFGLPGADLLATIGELKTRNLVSQAQQARLEERLVKQTITFPAYSDSATPLVGALLQATGLGLMELSKSCELYLSYADQDCQAYLAVGPENDGRRFFYKRGRLIQTQLGHLPRFCDLHINSNEFEVSQSLTAVQNRDLADSITSQWPQRLHELVEKSPNRLSKQLILLALLESAVLDETKTILRKQPVWPTMHGLLSMENIVSRLQEGDFGVSYCRCSTLGDLPGLFQGQNFRGNPNLLSGQPQYQNLIWPTDEQPLVLAVDTKTTPHLSKLPQLLKKPLCDVTQSFQASLFSRWKSQIYASYLVEPPPAYETLDLEEVGFLSIPTSPRQNGLILRNRSRAYDQFEELSFSFPLCGALASKPSNLEEKIGELYANFSQSRQRNEQALLAFCLQHLDLLSKEATQLTEDTQALLTPNWKGTILKTCWLPAQENSWVSLLQLHQWGREGVLPRPLPYLASPGRPRAGLDFPLLVLTTPESIQLISRWTKRKLEPTPPQDTFHLANNVYQQGLGTVSKVAIEASDKLGNLVGPAFRKLDFNYDLKTSPVYRSTAKLGSVITGWFSKDEGSEAKEDKLKQALLRESRRLTGGSRDSRSRVESQLKSITFSKHLFGPAFWRTTDTKKLCLNRSHRQIRDLILNKSENQSRLLALLMMLTAEINLESPEISDLQEIAMLEFMLTTLVDGFPDGFYREPPESEVSKIATSDTVPSKPAKKFKKRRT